MRSSRYRWDVISPAKSSVTGTDRAFSDVMEHCRNRELVYLLGALMTSHLVSRRPHRLRQCARTVRHYEFERWAEPPAELTKESSCGNCDIGAATVRLITGAANRRVICSSWAAVRFQGTYRIPDFSQSDADSRWRDLIPVERYGTHYTRTMSQKWKRRARCGCGTRSNVQRAVTEVVAVSTSTSRLIL